MTDLFLMKVGLSSRRPDRPMPRQAGAATLAVAVIMLLVVSVLVFHSHAAGWLEQRATTNQSRAKQAHAAAEAGLEAALAVLNADTGTTWREQYLTANGDGTFSSANAPLTGSPGLGLSYAVTFTAINLGPATPPNTFLLQSTGGSDCTNFNAVGTCSSQARLTEVVRSQPILRATPPDPVTTGASFESFFGAPETTIKGLTTPLTNSSSVGTSGGFVWFQGNLNLVGDVGTQQRPVLLVVEGNLTMSAGIFHGFIYVKGNLSCAGCSSPSILGAIAVSGNHNPTVNVTFNQAVMDRLGTAAPRFAKVIGTWRDW